jgi:hypothetical protein
MELVGFLLGPGINLQLALKADFFFGDFGTVSI